MCLLLNNKYPIIATKDITVYKIVYVNKIGMILAPIQREILTEYAKRYGPPRFKPTLGSYEIASEGVFAYTSLKKAAKDCSMIRGITDTYKIIKGTIPKGTKYWLCDKVIAAQHIIFNVPKYQRILMHIKDRKKRKIYNKVKEW